MKFVEKDFASLIMAEGQTATIRGEKDYEAEPVQLPTLTVTQNDKEQSSRQERAENHHYSLAFPTTKLFSIKVCLDHFVFCIFVFLEKKSLIFEVLNVD